MGERSDLFTKEDYQAFETQKQFEALNNRISDLERLIKKEANEIKGTTGFEPARRVKPYNPKKLILRYRRRGI